MPLIFLLRFLCSFFGTLLAVVAVFGTIIAACLVAALTYVRFSEGRLTTSDASLLIRAAVAVPVGVLLTWAGARLAKSVRWQDGAQSTSFRLTRGARGWQSGRVSLIAIWLAYAGIWSWSHLIGKPGWRIVLTAGVLASVFAAMHARLLLHEFAHLFAGCLCGLKPLALRVGSGPRLWTGESRSGFRWEWRLWPVFGWAESLHFDGRSYRWRQFVTVAAGPLTDALLVAGVWRWLTGPGRELAKRFLLTDNGGLTHDGMSMAMAVVLVFGPSMIFGLWPRRVVLDGRWAYTDGWWLVKVFFLPSATIKAFFGGQRISYAVRLWKSSRREASREQLAEMQALFPEHEAEFILLESRLHEESEEPEPAAECFRRALESMDGLAPANRRNVLIEYAAALAAAERVERARQVAEVLLARTMAAEERIETLDALACLPILHQGTLALLSDAERWCAEARALAPETVTLRGTWGALLVEANREEEAVPILEEVLASTQSDNDRGIGSFYLALAARRLGKRKEMLRHRQGALRWCKAPVLMARIPAELPAT